MHGRQPGLERCAAHASEHNHHAAPTKLRKNTISPVLYSAETNFTHMPMAANSSVEATISNGDIDSFPFMQKKCIVGLQICISVKPLAGRVVAYTSGQSKGTGSTRFFILSTDYR